MKSVLEAKPLLERSCVMFMRVKPLVGETLREVKADLEKINCQAEIEPLFGDVVAIPHHTVAHSKPNLFAR